MLEGLDFEFIPSADPKDAMAIRILTGIYKDTVFKYGKIKLMEHNDGLHLHFAFDVLESTYQKPKKLQRNKAFEKYVFDLFVALNETDDEFYEDGILIKEANEDRTNNPKESDL